MLSALAPIGRFRETLRPFYLRHIFFRLWPSRRPLQFERCWQTPHEFKGGLPCLDIPPPHPILPDILFLPMTDWHHRLQRTQRLAMALARLGKRCFLLNPHLGREYPSAPWRSRSPALAMLDERIFEIHAPLPAEPVFHHRLLSPAESRTVADSIHWALQRSLVRNLDIVFALPTWRDCALELSRRWNAPVLYDCHDWLAGFPNMAAEITALEAEALAAADAALFSASALQTAFVQAVPNVAPRSYELRNGVPDWPPAPKKRTPNAVAGYVGALEEWFWTDAVAAAAQAMPEVRFVLAGAPCPKVRRSLERFPNLTLLGEVPPEKVPDLIAGFRAGLIPFRGPLAPYTDPLKVYEYFHAGLPVVTSPLPELDRFGQLVRQASTVTGFVQALREALAENDPSLEESRRAEARAARWIRRAEQLQAILAEVRQRAGLGSA